MPTVDEILAGSPLAGLRRISPGGGDRGVAVVRLAERFAELDDAPPGSFVVLSRLASAEVTDYRLDMALRWAAIRRVAAVAAFSAEAWQPAVTALDIAEHADIEAPSGHFAAPEAGGEIGIAAGLVLHAAAAAAARHLDLTRRASQTPVRSRSELLAELLMSDSAISEDLLARARQLGIPVSGWHLAVRVEADDLDEAEHDEVRRFELLESAGQAALQAVSAAGETWYLSRIARAIILIRMTTSNPGPQAGARAARSAERALQAIAARLPALRFRAGVGAAHEGPMGLRASAAEARGALAAARAARRPAGVAAHDAVGIRRMLMEWYASETVRASVRDQLAPLEKLGPARADTAIRTLAAYLDEQGSVVKTAERLHLHRNAVTNRLRTITEMLDVDLEDPDQRLALQLACRARLLG